jgi:hypothetical protein
MAQASAWVMPLQSSPPQTEACANVFTAPSETQMSWLVPCLLGNIAGHLPAALWRANASKTW